MASGRSLRSSIPRGATRAWPRWPGRAGSARCRRGSPAGARRRRAAGGAVLGELGLSRKIHALTPRPGRTGRPSGGRSPAPRGRRRSAGGRAPRRRPPRSAGYSARRRPLRSPGRGSAFGLRTWSTIRRGPIQRWGLTVPAGGANDQSISPVSPSKASSSRSPRGRRRGRRRSGSRAGDAEATARRLVRRGLGLGERVRPRAGRGRGLEVVLPVDGPVVEAGRPAGSRWRRGPGRPGSRPRRLAPQVGRPEREARRRVDRPERRPLRQEDPAGLGRRGDPSAASGRAVPVTARSQRRTSGIGRSGSVRSPIHAVERVSRQPLGDQRRRASPRCRTPRGARRGTGPGPGRRRRGPGPRAAAPRRRGPGPRGPGRDGVVAGGGQEPLVGVGGVGRASLRLVELAQGEQGLGHDQRRPGSCARPPPAGAGPSPPGPGRAGRRPRGRSPS